MCFSQVGAKERERERAGEREKEGERKKAKEKKRRVIGRCNREKGLEEKDEEKKTRKRRT